MIDELDALCAAPAACASTALVTDSHFVDIGSGVGKLVVSIALLTPADSTGIEFVARRAAAADAGLSDAIAQGLVTHGEASRVHLLHADATEDGVLPVDTTHAFLPNLCFPGAPAEPNRLEGECIFSSRFSRFRS